MPQLIPKTIYQTWYTKNVSEDMANVITVLKDLNPDYQYRLYDDSDCEEYIGKEYPQFLSLYKSVIPGAYRADLWRLLILYQYGGVYVDAKQHHHRSLSTIIDPDVSMFVCKDRPKNYIYNAILGAVPRHPYIGYCILMTVYNIANCYKGKDPLDITGPRMIGELLGSIVCNNGDWSMRRYGEMDIPIKFADSNTLIVDRKGQVFASITYPTYYNTDRKQDYGTMYEEGRLYRHVPMKHIVTNRTSIPGIYPSDLNVDIIPDALDTVIFPIPVVNGDTIVFECINKDLCVHDITISYNMRHRKKVSVINSISIPISSCRMIDTSLPQKISRIIHQTGDYRQQPSYLYNIIDGTKRLNLEYEYRFYDDMDCREMIGNHFELDVQQAYDSLIPGAFRADLWRYCALYLYGGIYIDHKIVSLTPLRDIIRGDDTLVVCMDPIGTVGLYNAILACTPGHPLMKKAIDMCISNVIGRKDEEILGITGPTCLYRAYTSLYGPDIKEGRKDGVVVLRHEYMTYVRDMNGRKLFSKNNKIYENRAHSYITMYRNGCIFNTHIHPNTGSMPIMDKYRAYIYNNTQYQDVFDYRILPYEGGLMLMVQRRDSLDGWGQDLIADIYNGDDTIIKGVFIGKSNINIRIINIPVKR